MKDLRKVTLAIVLSVMAIMPLSAQDEIEGSVQADIVSQTIWRGQLYGNVGIQPSASIGYKGGLLKISGSTGLNSTDIKIFEASLGYNYKGVNIGVVDHWFSGIDASNRFFYFKAKKTPHFFEGNLGYTCKYGSLQVYTAFAGNDFKINGDRAYSTYIEMNIPFNIGGVRWDITAGGIPYKCQATETAYYDSDLGTYINYRTYRYAKEASCINASLKATKEFKLGKNFVLPIFAQFASNPYDQTAYMVFGVTLKP
jgi:hypothetical protein